MNMIPNIVVLGVGHSGTRIVVRMLEAMGWNLGTVKEGVAENLAVQVIDKSLLQEKGICPCGFDKFTDSVCLKCNQTLPPATKVRPQDYRQVLDNLPEPWVIKDPRMVLTFEEWKPHLFRSTFILLVERNPERMRKTYAKYGFTDFRIYGQDVTDLIDLARYHYRGWVGPKFKIQYEQIASAVELFVT